MTEYDIILDSPNTTIYRDIVKGRKKSGEGISRTVSDKIARR